MLLPGSCYFQGRGGGGNGALLSELYDKQDTEFS